MSDSVFEAAVPYLGGITTVSSGHCKLVFKHYKSHGDSIDWREEWVERYETKFDKVISISLTHVDTCIGMIPCVLARHSSQSDKYCIVKCEASVAVTTTNDVLMSSECGLMVMLNGDTIVDLDLGGHQCDQHWTFDWTRFKRYCTLVITKTSNAIQYILLSTDGGVISRLATPTQLKYIPSEYNAIVETVAVHWRVKFNGRCLVYTPIFLVGTTMKQVLLFEGGVTLACIQLDHIPLQMTSLKVPNSLLILCVRMANSQVLLYRIEATPTDPSYKARAELIKSITCRHGDLLTTVGGDFIGKGDGDQLLLVKKRNQNGELEFEIINSFFDESLAAAVPAARVEGEGKISQPLLSTSRALEMRRMWGEVMVIREKQLLQRKVEMLAHGLETINGEGTAVGCGKHLLPLFDDVVQPLTPGEVNKPHPPNLRVLNHWQRIVDDTVWTMSVVIANDCPRDISNVVLSLTPPIGPTRGCSCRQVSLSCPSSPLSPRQIQQLVSAHSLPSHSRSCFVISADSYNMPRPPSHLLATYTLEGGVVTYQLLLQNVLKADAPFPFRSNPLHTLAHIWTGEHLIVTMNKAPSPQLMDLISHLGSKQSIEIQLSCNQSMTTLQYRDLVNQSLKRLPFPVVYPLGATSLHMDEFHWLFLGVCLVCHSNETSITSLSVYYRSVEELEVIKSYIRKEIPANFSIIE